MTPRVFVYLDTQEKNHNPSFNLFFELYRHRNDGDLRVGDVFITHPAFGPVIDAVVSVLTVTSADPLFYECDLADPETLDIWHQVKLQVSSIEPDCFSQSQIAEEAAR